MEFEYLQQRQYWPGEPKLVILWPFKKSLRIPVSSLDRIAKKKISPDLLQMINERDFQDLDVTFKIKTENFKLIAI